MSVMTTIHHKINFNKLLTLMMIKLRIGGVDTSEQWALKLLLNKLKVEYLSVDLAQ